MGERGISGFGHPASRLFTCGIIIFIVIDHLEFWKGGGFNGLYWARERDRITIHRFSKLHNHTNRSKVPLLC